MLGILEGFAKNFYVEIVRLNSDLICEDVRKSCDHQATYLQ